MIEFKTGLRAEHHRLLLEAIIQPASLIGYDNRQWELLLRLARRAQLSGYLAARLEREGLLDNIPIRAANLLRSGLIQARKQQQSVRWELNRVRWALDDSDMPVIVLKGMAYLLQDLPNAAGRMFADLDLLVSKENLRRVEAALLKKGWQHHALTDYDERYYREWSHEIPALVHPERSIEVDVHHTLSSPLGKLKIDPQSFREAAIEVKEAGCYVLSPEDMVLHCAVNLFQNNELADDLRHLVDFSELLLFFSNRQPLFRQKLIGRANQLGLGKPLFYGLYFSRLLLRSAIPDGLEKQLDRRPGRIAQCVMHYCVPLALLPQHPDYPARRAKYARMWLYWRSHWLRMPLYRLLPHLAYKFYLSVLPARTEISKQK
ncbi:nucleotidyltransferase family protein [Nitrosomonas sp.]|uniref:nucleotidyltransferase domain-containing protein n=1 Tax=Nitrosomonas sp. TaxID=42353 RepID=UPI0025EA9E4C|nr:nucleotidyltransferase family protein [Nitrosomonas sp.]MCC6917181.1 nucleotidyltransferase family protein [Nitrosomonas sp.]